MYHINLASLSSPAIFAAEELKKYLRMMMVECGNIEINYNDDTKDGFRLGLMSDFNLDTSDAKDVVLDDIIYIDTDENGGIIAGSNPRSILLAVYKYLKLNGCRFLFPGIDGEYIPQKNIEKIKYRKLADNRFRGQCNEGSESQQDVINAIDFIPKAGLNTFMIEFDVPFFYYDRYYSHRYNYERLSETVTAQTIKQWRRASEDELAKRGIQLHDMGHGWTAEPFGIDTSTGWFPGLDINEGCDMTYVAKVNGKREFFMGGVPLCTNFCMGNKDARKIAVDFICDYAKRNSHVDFLHIWLADDSNNHCECEICQEKTPSDWYIIWMNELDEELERRNLDTRITFIAYVDTLWAPLEEKIKNLKRFSLLYAPIGRVYTQGYDVEPDYSQLTPYVRNKLTWPHTLGANLAYLSKWQENYKGDCMAYEYHFFKPLYADPGQIELSKCIYNDIQNLKKCGLSGIIEDQTQKCTFPTGFAQFLYAESLFDESAKYEDIEKDYFIHAFGENYKVAYDYLNSLSTLHDFEYTTGGERFYDKKLVEENKVFYRPSMKENFEKSEKICKDFIEVARKNIDHKTRIISVSWQLLYYHANFYEILSRAYAQKCVGNEEEAKKIFKQAQNYISKVDPYIEKYFDLCLFFECHPIFQRESDGYHKDGEDTKSDYNIPVG